jgi:hypothetical protein
MNGKQKHQALYLFLSSLDCSRWDKVDIDPLTFSYQAGSNEGGYMTIGGYEYRCHCSTEKSYLEAVAFYLTLV